MDEHERSTRRFAPRERRERDAGSVVVNADPAARSAPSSAAATAGGRSAAVATIARKVRGQRADRITGRHRSGTPAPGGEMARRPRRAPSGPSVVARRSSAVRSSSLGPSCRRSKRCVSAFRSTTRRAGLSSTASGARRLRQHVVLRPDRELTDDGSARSTARIPGGVASRDPDRVLDIETARRIWLVVDLALIVVTLVVLFAALPALRSPPRTACSSPCACGGRHSGRPSPSGRRTR